MKVLTKHAVAVRRKAPAATIDGYRFSLAPNPSVRHRRRRRGGQGEEVPTVPSVGDFCSADIDYVKPSTYRAVDREKETQMRRDLKAFRLRGFRGKGKRVGSKAADQAGVKMPVERTMSDAPRLANRARLRGGTHEPRDVRAELRHIDKMLHDSPTARGGPRVPVDKRMTRKKDDPVQAARPHDVLVHLGLTSDMPLRAVRHAIQDFIDAKVAHIVIGSNKYAVPRSLIPVLQRMTADTKFLGEAFMAKELSHPPLATRPSKRDCLSKQGKRDRAQSRELSEAGLVEKNPGPQKRTCDIVAAMPYATMLKVRQGLGIGCVYAEGEPAAGVFDQEKKKWKCRLCSEPLRIRKDRHYDTSRTIIAPHPYCQITELPSFASGGGLPSAAPSPPLPVLCPIAASTTNLMATSTADMSGGRPDPPRPPCQPRMPGPITCVQSQPFPAPPAAAPGPQPDSDCPIGPMGPSTMELPVSEDPHQEDPDPDGTSMAASVADNRDPLILDGVRPTRVVCATAYLAKMGVRLPKLIVWLFSHLLTVDTLISNDTQERRLVVNRVTKIVEQRFYIDCIRPRRSAFLALLIVAALCYLPQVFVVFFLGRLLRRMVGSTATTLSIAVFVPAALLAIHVGTQIVRIWQLRARHSMYYVPHLASCIVNEFGLRHINPATVTLNLHSIALRVTTINLPDRMAVHLQDSSERIAEAMLLSNFHADLAPPPEALGVGCIRL